MKTFVPSAVLVAANRCSHSLLLFKICLLMHCLFFQGKKLSAGKMEGCCWGCINKMRAYRLRFAALTGTRWHGQRWAERSPVNPSSWLWQTAVPPALQPHELLHLSLHLLGLCVEACAFSYITSYQKNGFVTISFKAQKKKCLILYFLARSFSVKHL